MANKVQGYMPDDQPPWGPMLSLGFQQVLTMFPATVLVAILTKFDVGATLAASGLGTIIALLVAGKKIPLYYGSSFSYIAVVVAAMKMYDPVCFGAKETVYCAQGVQIVQMGIIGTGLVEILVGWFILRIGKASLDRVLPPIITGSIAVVIGIALAGAALNMAAAHWGIAFATLFLTVAFSVYLQGKGLAGMLPIMLGAVAGYLVAVLVDVANAAVPGYVPLVDFARLGAANWIQMPSFTLPAFTDPRAWASVAGIALIAIATIPESTAHLYQMSLYIDQLAQELGRAPTSIKNLIGLNLVADGADDLVVGMVGGCAGTNYGENNSLMAITRNYSVPVLMVAGTIAIGLGFVGKLAALVNTIPGAVTGGLAIYLFGVIGMQGVALIQSERVNLFDPRQLAVGAIVLITGIGGNAVLPNGYFPFQIPVLMPDGIPAIVFAAICGILLNVLFLVLPPEKFGVEEHADVNAPKLVANMN